MKKIKFLFSTVLALVLLAGFSNQAIAQEFHYYKGSVTNTKFKIQDLRYNYGSLKIWVRNSPTDSWESRYVYDGDEELIKYKVQKAVYLYDKYAGTKEYDFVLEFPGGKIGYFILHRPKGSYNGTTIPQTEKFILIE